MQVSARLAPTPSSWVGCRDRKHKLVHEHRGGFSVNYLDIIAMLIADNHELRRRIDALDLLVSGLGGGVDH